MSDRAKFYRLAGQALLIMTILMLGICIMSVIISGFSGILIAIWLIIAVPCGIVWLKYFAEKNKKQGL